MEPAFAIFKDFQGQRFHLCQFFFNNIRQWHIPGHVHLAMSYFKHATLNTEGTIIKGEVSKH